MSVTTNCQLSLTIEGVSTFRSKEPNFERASNSIRTCGTFRTHSALHSTSAIATLVSHYHLKIGECQKVIFMKTFAAPYSASCYMKQSHFILPYGNDPSLFHARISRKRMTKRNALSALCSPVCAERHITVVVGGHCSWRNLAVNKNV